MVEILVADGGSADGDASRSRRRAPGSRIIDNPECDQAAGLNRIIAEARGDVIVRVDGHCVLAADYVARCVDVLSRDGAAMVGGAMTPTRRATAWRRAIGSALVHRRVGAGPARFHVGGDAGWVDTVYLGAYRTADARAVGGYATEVGTNEDAEFALRMDGAVACGSIRASVRSTCRGRRSARWGGSSSATGGAAPRTVRKHPESLRARQIAAPVRWSGLLSPWRKQVAAVYVAVLLAGAIRARCDGAPSRCAPRGHGDHAPGLGRGTLQGLVGDREA